MDSTTPPPPVLIIAASGDLITHLSQDLTEMGYEVQAARSPDEGVKQAKRLKPALIVVDRSLANQSGLAVCERLRAAGLCSPILLLMARDTLEDRIACLEAGADDYCLKPYRTDAFLTVAHTYLQPGQVTTEQLRFGELSLELASHTAHRNGRAIELTTKEFELLRYLMEHPREVMTREQILENVWGYDFMGESNVIEVYVRYLRLKIDGNDEKRLIQTVRGVGYVLRES